MSNSNNAFKRSLISAAVALALVSPAIHALEITAEVNYSLDGGAVQNDIDGPQGTGTVDVLAGAFSANSDIFYHTYGSDNGNFGSRVSGNGTYDITGIFTYSDTITNNTGIDQNYDFGFTVVPGELSASISSTALGSEFTMAGYDIDILLNGVSIWDSSATVRADSTGTSFSSAGTALTANTPNATATSINYNWNSFSDTLDLGLLNAGESFEFQYILSASASGNVVAGSNCGNGGFGDFEGGRNNDFGDFEGGGSTPCGSTARSGDPFGFGNTNLGQITASAASVPEPASLALLGLGLVGIAARRRKKA